MQLKERAEEEHAEDWGGPGNEEVEEIAEPTIMIQVGGQEAPFLLSYPISKPHPSPLQKRTTLCLILKLPHYAIWPPESILQPRAEVKMMCNCTPRPLKLYHSGGGGHWRHLYNQLPLTLALHRCFTLCPPIRLFLHLRA
jgi:hypothetical protein